MSRLLFAAARGARIEQYRNIHGAWMPAEVLPTSEGDSKSFRIHPADEHLQYGPISSALRDMAESNHMDEIQILYVMLKDMRFDMPGDRALLDKSTKLHRALFLLILSQALADEGL